MATCKPAEPAAPKTRARKAAETYAQNKAEASRLEGINDALKPQLIAYAGTRLLNLAEVAETPATPNVVITRNMVGSVIAGKKGRRGYTDPVGNLMA